MSSPFCLVLAGSSCADCTHLRPHRTRCERDQNAMRTRSRSGSDRVPIGFVSGCLGSKRLSTTEWDSRKPRIKRITPIGGKPRKHASEPTHHPNQLISAAQVFTSLGANGSQKPTHERQVRPLVGLSPEQAQLAWNFVQRVGRSRRTAHAPEPKRRPGRFD